MPSQRPESGGVKAGDLESTAKLPVLDVAAIDDLDVEDESHLRTTVLPPDVFASSDTHPGIPILKEPTGLASEDVRVVVREAAAASAATREQDDSRAAAEAEAAVGQVLERQAELLREMQEVREEAEARYQRLESDLDAARRLGEDLDAMRREAEARTLAAEQRVGAIEAGFSAAHAKLEADLLAARQRNAADADAARQQRESEVAAQAAAHGAALQAARDEAAELGRQLAQLRGLKSQDEVALASAREEIAALGCSLETAREGLSSAERGAQQSLADRGRELERVRGELAELRGLAAAQVEALQAAESRRGIWASLLGDAESSHDSQLREAREAADAERERAAAARAELEARMRQQGEREATLRVEIDAAADRAEDAERRAEDLRTALVQAQGALVIARADADGQAARLAEFESRLDALQSRERAAVEQAEAATATGVELGRQLQALQGRLDGSETAARAELEATRAEREQLRAELGALRTERDVRRSEHDSLLERHAALSTAAETAAARAVELEARFGAEDPAEALRTLQGELRRGVERISELESDLRAAEDQVNRLEGDLRVKSARLEELGRSPWPTHAGAPEVTSIGTRRRDEYAARGRGAGDSGATGESMLASDSAFSGAGAAASADGVTRYFVLMDGDTEIVHVLGRRTTIGRGLDNDVRIDTKFISRHHAVVLAGPNQTVVEDLRSTNGVLVNGRRVTRSVLRDGDIVHVGKTQFRFVQRHRER